MTDLTEAKGLDALFTEGEWCPWAFSKLINKCLEIDGLEKNPSVFSLKQAASIIGELKSFDHHMRPFLESLKDAIKQYGSENTIQQYGIKKTLNKINRGFKHFRLNRVIKFLWCNASDPTLQGRLLAFKTFLSELPDEDIDSIRLNTGYTNDRSKRGEIFIPEVNDIIERLLGLPEMLKVVAKPIAQKNFNVALSSPSL